jgi:polysaccharide pyruvyl transferase WcaK-like protein
MKNSIRRFFGGKRIQPVKSVKRTKSMAALTQRSGFDVDPQPEFRVLITSGLGYGNVGDEAQAAATVGRWKELVPECSVLLLSPNPEYTQKTHKVESSWSSRVLWFSSNNSKTYWQSKGRFKFMFAKMWFRQTLSARFLRAGWPISFATAEEMTLLKQIRDASVLHISGGGFLTGMTSSRLWDLSLVMRLCQILDTPYLLTGQTIGVFKSPMDKWLAKKSLSKADVIYLRDQGISENDLKGIGITGDHVKSTFDDAVFFKSLADEEAKTVLIDNGIDPERPYFIANYHYWGQDDEMKLKSSNRFAEITRRLMEKSDCQVLFVPMTPTDVDAEKDVMELMGNEGSLLDYKFDYQTARGVYRFASFVFTMKHHPIVFGYGEGIPVVSVALDDYYYHKNRGAMANCGHQEYCLSNEVFFGEQAISTCDKFLAMRDELASEVQQWVEAAKPIAMEPLERCLAINKFTS